jgi:hypothetical protein
MLLDRISLVPRAETEEWPGNTCRMSIPGIVLNRSPRFVAPDRRISSGVSTLTETGARATSTLVFVAATAISRLSSSSRLIWL